MKSLELKIPPVIVLACCLFLTWLIARYDPLLISIPFAKIIAAAIFAIGVFIALLGVLQFRKANTTVNPTTPDKSSEIVSDGIYKITRNPMYLGMALVVLSASILMQSPVSLLGLVAFIAYITKCQIIAEERTLHIIFEEQYENYISKVRRWI